MQILTNESVYDMHVCIITYKHTCKVWHACLYNYMQAYAQIEMENILSIILLLEHELWHVAYGMYDPDENDKQRHKLAQPSDIGFEGAKFVSSAVNYQGHGRIIPGNNASKKTQLAFTDPHGHGKTFSQLAYFGSGFRCQLSPFDMFDEDQEMNLGGTDEEKEQTPHPTRIEIKNPERGGRKKRRKKRTKRTRTKKKNLKGTKRKTRKKYRKKNYSSKSSS